MAAPVSVPLLDHFAALSDHTLPGSEPGSDLRAVPPAQHGAKRVRLVDALVVGRASGHAARFRQINHRGCFAAEIEECLAQATQEPVAWRALGRILHVAQNAQLCEKCDLPTQRLTPLRPS